MSETSRQKLEEFLDWAEAKGMMPTSTARALKGASKSVLSVLDETEEEDVLAVDLPSVFQRYENSHKTKVNPATMRAYRRRVNYALEQFRQFSHNPSSWKPTGVQRSTSAGSRSKGSKDEGSSSNGHVQISLNPLSEVKDAAQITHRFPLRRDVFVTIAGIPFDVKKGEMARLTAFLSNLVADQEEVVQAQFMLSASPDEDQ